MNEVGDSGPNSLTPTGTTPGLASAGTMMRSAREAAGLHVAALAVSLKIPVKKLEALERDRFDLLPDAVFVRALASSVCRTLKIDPQPVLRQLPQTVAPALRTDGTGINVPFRQSDTVGGWQFWRQWPRSFAFTLAALLLGILVLALFPFEDQGLTSSMAVSNPFPLKSDGVPELAPAAVQSSSEVLPVQESSTSLPSSTLRTSVTMNSTPEPSADASDSAASSRATSSVVPDQPAATLVFKASGVSWVEVVDAAGVVQLRRLLSDGEVVGASGVLPLSVVVGRSNTTQVQVRGKPFDLAPITRDNVARFEVK